MSKERGIGDGRDFDASVGCVELPVSCLEDGEAEAVFTFEFNDEEILCIIRRRLIPGSIPFCFIIRRGCGGELYEYFLPFMRVGNSGTVIRNRGFRQWARAYKRVRRGTAIIEVEESVSRWRLGTGK